jgi:hypothetical protein
VGFSLEPCCAKLQETLRFALLFLANSNHMNAAPAPFETNLITVDALSTKAQHLRLVASNHEVARTAAALAAPVMKAQDARTAIATDADHAVRSVHSSFARGWGLLHLRSRLSLQETQEAASAVVAGTRPALEALPELTVATLPGTAATPVHRSARAA